MVSTPPTFGRAEARCGAVACSLNGSLSPGAGVEPENRGGCAVGRDFGLVDRFCRSPKTGAGNGSLRDAVRGKRSGAGTDFGWVVGEMRGGRRGEFSRAGLQARCQTSRRGEAPLGGLTAEESRWVASCHALGSGDGLGLLENPLRFLVQPRTSSRVVHSAKSSP